MVSEDDGVMAIDGSTLRLAESEESEDLFEGQVAKGGVRGEGPGRASWPDRLRVLVRWSISRTSRCAGSTVNRISPSVCLSSDVTPDMLVLTRPRFPSAPSSRAALRRGAPSRRGLEGAPAHRQEGPEGGSGDEAPWPWSERFESRKPQPHKMPRHRVHNRRLEHRLQLTTTCSTPTSHPPRNWPASTANAGDGGCYEELKITQCGLRRLHGLRGIRLGRGSRAGVLGKLRALSAEPRPGPSRRRHDP